MRPLAKSQELKAKSQELKAKNFPHNTSFNNYKGVPSAGLSVAPRSLRCCALRLSPDHSHP